MATTPDEQILRIMARQQGVITRRQALAEGLSSDQIAYRLRTGQWLRIVEGTYRATSSRMTFDARMVAVRLSFPAGLAFSHHTAARFHGLGVRPEAKEVWVTVPLGGTRLVVPGVKVMVSRRLAGHTVPHGEWQFTSAARTLVDLGQCMSARQLERVVYAAVQAKKVTLEEVQDAWRAISRRPVKSVVPRVLERFDRAYDSGVEADAGRIFDSHGIRLERQYRVRDRGKIVRRFDFADPECRIGVEIDGVAYHSSLQAQQRDRAKDRELAMLGWVTIRFTTADVRRDPARMVRTIEELRRRRRHEGTALRRT